ncbi:MAG: translation initiation factor IF-2 [bacterium]|nr:translation initiation factor IF-2 [bacterium]MDZ4299306.1 translation initiation factor IF-2 [Candidatus Sungbacteria bacterium]
MPKKGAEQKHNEPEVRRPPVVVVMGHIDHGKTTILDWYRKSRVAAGEAGGITQHVGAYEVEYHGKKLTFIDTPGHEAFSGIRSRGAKVADLAILVVAADEGVKLQTKEAIAIIKKNELPFVVAVNKIDRSDANEERVRSELAAEDVLVEAYGGKVPSVAVSAKDGTHMDDLLELLLLTADLEDLAAHPNQMAEGVVVEAQMDPRRGTGATFLIHDGTLRRGEFMVVGRAIEAARIFENFLGKSINEAGPSAPVQLAGLSVLPSVGERFRTFANRKEAEEFVATLPEEEVSAGRVVGKKSERPVFHVILKADVVGSREALEEQIKKLEREEVGIEILQSGVGDITETDVKFARATERVTIVGFKVKIDPSVRELAERSHMRVITGTIIYEVLDAVRAVITSMVEPDMVRVDLGRAKILKCFKREGARQVVGGKVEEGVLRNGAQVEIVRNKRVLGGMGVIAELQQNRQHAEEVRQGSEFGVLVDARETIQAGDILVCFVEESTKRLKAAAQEELAVAA